MENSRILVQLADPFLILAALLLVVDGYLLWRGYAEKMEVYRKTLFSAALACGLIIITYGILTLAFITDSFWVKDVYSYSSSSLPFLYKLGNPWIGSNGSLLFITVLLALFYGIYRVKGSGDHSKFRTTVYIILDSFIIFFILVTLIKSPFEVLPATPLEGVGLNPLLQTSWVLSHPPIIFLGYVSVFFAFALLFAGMITRTSESPEVKQLLKLTLYAAWLLLTIGIALGGLWSYRVLGWGGYWAWDPVETASLLPWLALTAYFHLSSAGKDSAKEHMLMITFFMVIFATALTRGGFSESVHAFGESPVGFVFLGFAVGSLLIFLWYNRRLKKPLTTFAVDTTTLFSISRFVAAWSLIALLIVCFIGAAAPLAGSVVAGGPVNIRAEFYTLLCYPFTFTFVAALIGCNILLKPRNYAILIAAVVGIGGVMAFFGFPTPYALTNFGLPILVTAGSVIAYQWIQVLRTKQFFAPLWGKMLVHLAIIIILLGVFISSAAQVESNPVLATPRSSIDALDSSIAVNDFSISAGKGRIYFPSHSLVAPEYSSLKTDVTILEGGVVHHGSLWMYEYLNYGVVSEPLIISTPSKDLYVSMHQTNSSYTSLVHALMGETIPPKDVTIVVKYVPLIWLVWLGTLLMGIGMSTLFLDELLRTRISE
jgi:cytochrome c-type biogenesis protein CcmF